MAKGQPQYHAPRKKYKFRTFLVNGAYIAILEVKDLKGGYTAWGETRVDALTNVMNLAGRYIKSLED